VLRFDEEEPAELLLRLGVGSVGRGDLAAVDPNGSGRPYALQRVRHDVVAAAPELIGVVEGRVDESLHLALGQCIEDFLVVVDRKHELHGLLLWRARAGQRGTCRSSGTATLDASRSVARASGDVARELPDRLLQVAKPTGLREA